MLRRGTDVTLASYGVMTDELMTAGEILAEAGVSAEIVKLCRIAPLDPQAVLDSLRRTGRLLVLEDVVENGGVARSWPPRPWPRGSSPGRSY